MTALIKNGYLVVANAGDCQAVLSRNGKVESITCDHRPGRQEERERIENSGLITVQGSMGEIIIMWMFWGRV